MKAKSNRGGRRPGAGNPGTPRVEERRQGMTVMVLPSLLKAFREKWGRGASRRVEEMMKNDLS